MAEHRLLTFAPMIDSETTRLLCGWYGIAYDEADHLFGWVSLLTLLHGGYGRVPLLYRKELRLSGPRAVVDQFDARTKPDRRLLRLGSEAAGVEADWTAYNGDFARDVAVFAYFHLLADRALMTPIFAAPLPRREASLMPQVYPAMAWLLTTLLRLTSDQAAAASVRICSQFAAVDRRLGDGRPFLFGDRPTLGDIAFAAAAAPLLQPDGFGAIMPAANEMPPAICEIVAALQPRRAAAYVDQVYASVGAVRSEIKP